MHLLLALFAQPLLQCLELLSGRKTDIASLQCDCWVWCKRQTDVSGIWSLETVSMLG